MLFNFLFIFGSFLLLIQSQDTTFNISSDKHGTFQTAILSTGEIVVALLASNESPNSLYLIKTTSLGENTTIIQSSYNVEFGGPIAALKQGGFVVLYVKGNKAAFQIYENNMTVRGKPGNLGFPNTAADYYSLIALKNGTFLILQGEAKSRNYYFLEFDHTGKYTGKGFSNSFNVSFASQIIAAGGCIEMNNGQILLLSN